MSQLQAVRLNEETTLQAEPASYRVGSFLVNRQVERYLPPVPLGLPTPVQRSYLVAA